jgi:hypothetical protein
MSIAVHSKPDGSFEAGGRLFRLQDSGRNQFNVVCEDGVPIGTLTMKPSKSGTRAVVSDAPDPRARELLTALAEHLTVPRGILPIQ